MITLTSKERRELQRLVSRPTEEAGAVRRAHVVLWSADGLSGAEIARRLHLSAEAVSRIRRRFVEGGVEGLATQPKAGRKDHAVPAAKVERVIELAMSPPPSAIFEYLEIFRNRQRRHSSLGMLSPVEYELWNAS